MATPGTIGSPPSRMGTAFVFQKRTMMSDTGFLMYGSAGGQAKRMPTTNGIQKVNLADTSSQDVWARCGFLSARRIVYALNRTALPAVAVGPPPTVSGIREFSFCRCDGVAP
eukprot:7361154-Prymnesium_polylepis.1